MPNDAGSELSDPRAGGAVLGGSSGDQWFGHPRGLSTLFFTEMWERFSYYGMRAVLILFMTEAVTADNPGLGFGTAESAAIYGLYTFFVYVLALPGGWVADKLWGQRKSVFVGGVIIMLGHLSLAIPTTSTFFLGLALIVMGTGLLKPNVSAMVGDLYPEGGARRDAGFSIFYMGINLGSVLGVTLVGWVGEGYNYHWGFSIAALGMFLGLVQYKLGGRHIEDAGNLEPDVDAAGLRARGQRFYLIAAVATGLAVLVGYLMSTDSLGISISELAEYLGYVVVGLATLYFIFLFVAGGLTGVEKKRLGVIVWLFVLAAIFWSGFEQAGSSLNLFARDYTDRMFGDWEMPASLLQNVNAFFIILLAPVFGSLWTWLARKNANPSIPLKFGIGLLGLAVGFFVLAWGAANATTTAKVGISWLVVTYFFHTVGELSLSPVGLSSMTKLAPAGRVGQMMGVWFMAAALGNLFAGLVAGGLEGLPPGDLFMNVATTIGIAGVVAVIVAPFVKRFTAGVE
ncbi:MAG: peptide MFS transporter [Bacteroidota bacterium]